MPHESNTRQPLSQPLLTLGKSVAGIDGCRAGWVMVRRNGDGSFDSPRIAGKLADLPLADMDMAVIDIPIGLPNKGLRVCDLEARKLLGLRRSSVFTGARRPLLRKKCYEAANATGKREEGRGVSKQLWNIRSKICEVDEWITDEWIASPDSRTLREGHPELAFCAAAGRPMRFSKKQPGGETERVEALSGFVDHAVLWKWLDIPSASNRSKSNVAWDDILDALVLCRTAARVVLDDYRQIPADPPKDARGLPMEMVF